MTSHALVQVVNMRIHKELFKLVYLGTSLAPPPFPLSHELLHLGTSLPGPVGKRAVGLRRKGLLAANNLVLSLFGNILLHYSILHCKSQLIL